MIVRDQLFIDFVDVEIVWHTKFWDKKLWGVGQSFWDGRSNSRWTSKDTQYDEIKFYAQNMSTILGSDFNKIERANVNICIVKNLHRYLL